MQGRRIKGRMVISGRKFIKDRGRGRDLTDVVTRMSPPARALMSERLNPSEWYLTAAADECMTSCAVALGDDPRLFARDLGYHAAYETAGAIGRTFAQLFLSPDRIARHIASARAQIYDSGVCSARFADDVLTIDVADWSGHSENGCLNMLGLLERYGALCRGFTLLEATQPSCVSGGQTVCGFALRFRPR